MLLTKQLGRQSSDDAMKRVSEQTGPFPFAEGHDG